MIPITVITGFLGSGKSTILRAILDDPRFRRTAAILADTQPTAIDYYSMPGHPEQRIEALSGCSAERLHEDVGRAVFDILLPYRDQRRAFDRILIELDGTVDPSHLANTLATNTHLRKYAYLAGIVAVVDGINGIKTFDSYPVAIRQVSSANRIVITKSDLLGDAGSFRSFKSLVATSRQYSPRVPIARWPDPALDLATLFSLTSYDAEKPAIPARPPRRESGVFRSTCETHESDNEVRPDSDCIESHWLTVDEPIDPSALDLFIGFMRVYRGAEVLRVKGIVRLSNDPGRVWSLQAAQSVVHDLAHIESRLAGDRRSKILVTTRNITNDSIESLLTMLRLRPDEIQSEAMLSEARRIEKINAITDKIAFDDRGLVATILQREDTREVITLTWLDREAFVRIMMTGRFDANFQIADCGIASKGETVLFLVNEDREPADKPSTSSLQTFADFTPVRVREHAPSQT